MSTESNAAEAALREALAAIEFALAVDDHYDMREFLRGWTEGDTSEWPEFAASLCRAPAATSDLSNASAA